MTEPTTPAGGAETRPEISEAEASFLETQAGMVAAKAAAAKGSDPAAIAAVGTAAQGSKTIAGIEFHQPTAGSIYAMESAAGAMPDLSQMGSLALVVYCFAKPEDAFNFSVRIDEGDTEAAAAMIRAARHLTAPFTAAQLKECNAWIGEELARLKGDADDLGLETDPKPTPAPVAGAGSTTPPGATAGP